MNGQVLPAALKAIALLNVTFSITEAAITARKEVTLEHPVGRREGIHAIEGREHHSTIWDTTAGMQLLQRHDLQKLIFD